MYFCTECNSSSSS